MIIDVHSYLKDEDLRTFADFVRTSVQKKDRTEKWLVLLECAYTRYPKRILGPGYATDILFSTLVNDAAGDTGAGASLYRESVCNAIAGRYGISEKFSEQEILQIFETVKYLKDFQDNCPMDTEKIFLPSIPLVSRIYHFCDPSLWMVYDQDISSILDRFAHDFQKVGPAAADRLGDSIRFPSPDSLEGSERAAIKFVQASLVLRSIAGNLDEHRVMIGTNPDWWPDHKWGPSQVAAALSWLNEAQKSCKEKQPDNPLFPSRGRLSEREKPDR